MAERYNGMRQCVQLKAKSVMVMQRTKMRAETLRGAIEAR